MSAPPPRNVLPGSHLVIWPADDVIGVMMYQERGGCLDCEIAWRGDDYWQALDFATRRVLDDGYDLIDYVGGRFVVWNEGGCA
ncbi:MAG: hypothetical protein WBO09_13700 [Methylocystis silviterrae]|uniref:hypothetical protein n=1 Tax=Methylocystis silviterrae TaxID=2743612 RepID=UPI003BDB55A9